MYNYLYYHVAINELVEAEPFAFDKLIVDRVELLFMERRRYLSMKFEYPVKFPKPVRCSLSHNNHTVNVYQLRSRIITRVYTKSQACSLSHDLRHYQKVGLQMTRSRGFRKIEFVSHSPFSLGIKTKSPWGPRAIIRKSNACNGNLERCLRLVFDHLNG